MLMASFRPQTFASFFSERLASEAARSSSATASTPCAISSASATLRRNRAGMKLPVEWVISDSDMRTDKVAQGRDGGRAPALRLP